jgi:hypothetical protein
MKTFKTFLAGTVASAAMLTIANPASAAEVVKNGSFENGLNDWGTFNLSGVTPGQGITVITTGGTNSTGYGDNVPTYAGTHAAFFVDDKAFQNLYQSVSLVAGTKYTLSYALFATPSGNPNPFGFALTDTLGLHIFDIATNNKFFTDVAADGTWKPFSFEFTVPTTKSYLLNFNFVSGNTPAKDVLLDAVSISGAVPEPSTWAMMILGIGFAGVAMRRKNQAVSYNFA